MSATNHGRLSRYEPWRPALARMPTLFQLPLLRAEPDKPAVPPTRR